MHDNHATPDAASYDVEADDPNPEDPDRDQRADRYAIDGNPCTKEEYDAHADTHTVPDPSAARKRPVVTGLPTAPPIGRLYSEVAREAEEEAKAKRLEEFRRRAELAQAPSAPVGSPEGRMGERRTGKGPVPPAHHDLRDGERRRVPKPPPKHAKGQGCFCGCGLSTVGYFVPGHDAKLRTKLGVKLKGDELLDAALHGGFGPKGATK